MPQPEEEELCYKDMSDLYYYGATIIYYSIMVLGSCVIPSVDVIFEFVGTICVNCIAFLFPAAFYLIADNRYQAKVRMGMLRASIYNKPNSLLRSCAYLQFALGVAAFIAGMFNNVEEIINHE